MWRVTTLCLAAIWVVVSQAFVSFPAHRAHSLKCLARSGLLASHTSNDHKSSSLLHRIKTRLPTFLSSPRGSYYNNTTILTPSDAAHAVGVLPTLEASKSIWQTAWKLHRLMLPILHFRLWDKCKMKDSKLALAVLWWKAISGNNVASPVYDHGLSYDLLPPITRLIVHPVVSPLYPRLHHANVEIRTAYLDKAVSAIISKICHHYQNSASTSSIQRYKPVNIMIIIMGGGYDTRSFKMIEHNLVNSVNPPPLLQRRRKWRWVKLFKRRRQQQPNPLDNLPPSKQYNLQCYELDLPQVVQTKRRLIQSRLSRRRPWFSTVNESVNTPSFFEVDFNNLNQTKKVLKNIVSSNETHPTANIILFEGVMIYLDKGVPHALLEVCSEVLQTSGSDNNYLCFADRLDNIPGGDEELARVEMNNTGWELVDWLSKPGLARHMGVASLK